MKIVPIFGPLYAVHYPEDEQHVYSKLMSQWQDVSYLIDFFADHEAELVNFLPKRELTVAVTVTIESAIKANLALSSSCSADPHNVAQHFMPISKYDPLGEVYERKKSRWDWLRLYAVRISPDRFIITGGAIKLTQKIQDSSHTLRELQRLKDCCQYLRKKGIEDEGGLLDWMAEDYE